MPNRCFSWIAPLASIALAAAVAHAGHGDDERCRSRDRACLIAASFTYLDSLVSGDGSHMAAAPGIYRVNDGGLTVEGEQEVRDGQAGECTIVSEVGHFRWVVDEQLGEAIVFYDMLLDPTRGRPCGPPLTPREQRAPVWNAERFTVFDGLIHEVEVNSALGSTPGGSCPVPARRDTDFGAAGCGTNTRRCVRETASLYLAGELARDASRIPLAPDAWSLENCVLLGDDADEIAFDVEAPALDPVVAIEDERWFIDGDQAVVYYARYTHPSGDPATPRDQWDYRSVARRIRTDDGLIKEIETIFGSGAFPPGTSSPDFPDHDGDGIDQGPDNCHRTPNPGQQDRGGIASDRPDGIGDACQCGDVTGNGIVNGQDVHAVRRHGLGLSPNPTFADAGNCDVSGNGACNGQDASAISRETFDTTPNPLFGQHCANARP